MALLKAENLSKSFDDRIILKNVSFEIELGETVAVLGVSGGGKTTLFNCLSGLLLPDGGKVILKNEEITGKPGYLSYMLQKDLLLEHKKIIDNVCLPLILSGVKMREAIETVTPFFKGFGLEGTENKYPKALSGGMRQRVAFLRTYVASDGVVLLDEPFSALDTITKASIHEWFSKMATGLKLTTLFITHDIDEAIALADRIFILKGTPGQLSDEVCIDHHQLDINDFKLSEYFINYKKEVLRKLM